MRTLVKYLNDLAGTSGLEEQGAANAAAGTSGLDTQGALNALAGTSGLAIQGVLNHLAGTSGLGVQEAAQLVSAKNLLTRNQASVETDTTGLSAADGTPTIARSTVQAAHGVASLSFTTSAAGLQAAGVSTSAKPAVTEGSTYTATVSIRSAAVSRTGGVYLVWWTSGGAYISTSFNVAYSTSTSAWTDMSVTDVAPATAAFATVLGGVTDSAAAAEVHYLDKFGLWAGSSTVWTP